MDIRSKAPYPAGALSNFAPHAFEIDGVRCASMEGFLQSLKFEDPEMQRAICGMKGPEANGRGGKRNAAWKAAQTLWWRSVALDRHGDEYQRLLDRAYEALSAVAGFREALLATGDEPLTHEIGKDDATATVLTNEEFLGRLLRLREQARRREPA